VQRRGLDFAAGDPVDQDQLEEVGAGHLLLPGKGEPLGQSGQYLSQLERPQSLAQIWADGSRMAAVTGHLARMLAFRPRDRPYVRSFEH
jgi:hypothetical protein